MVIFVSVCPAAFMSTKTVCCSIFRKLLLLLMIASEIDNSTIFMDIGVIGLCRYKFSKYLSVVMISCGIVICTLASARHAVSP